MSRKQFVKIASAFANTKPEKGVRLAQWKLDVEAIARVCAGENGSFDRSRFLSACGYYD